MKLQAGVGGWSEDLEESLPMLSGEPGRLSSELVNLSRDAEARAAIAAQGAKVVEEVDVAGVAEKLAALYRSILV